MILTGLARLGADCEVRYLQDGTPVGDLSLAWNYGKKGSDGKRPTQWVRASIWGDRAEKLAPHLTKGSAISVVLDDVHIEEYERRDGGTGTALKGRVSQLEFAGGGRREGGEERPARQEAEPASKPQPAKSGGGAFDEMDDDIPF